VEQYLTAFCLFQFVCFGFTLAGQALYHLSHAASPHYCSDFHFLMELKVLMEHLYVYLGEIYIQILMMFGTGV
jgi:hypothetical protein